MDEINGTAAPEGKTYLVVNITVTNSFDKEITMYDMDFIAL